MYTNLGRQKNEKDSFLRGLKNTKDVSTVDEINLYIILEITEELCFIYAGHRPVKFTRTL